MIVGFTTGRLAWICGTRPSTTVVKPTWKCAQVSTLPNEWASGSHRKWMSSWFTTFSASMAAGLVAPVGVGELHALGRPVVPEV